MRKDGIVRLVYSMALILVLSVKLIPSSPSLGKAYSPELRAAHRNESPHDSVRPIIRHIDRIDRNFNGIQDSLEALTAQLTADTSAVFRVVVTLYNPVTSQDLDWFMMLGGLVTHVYQYVTYGFAGVIPAVNMSRFASLEKENLCIIERDMPVRYFLDVSVPLIRARPTVWNTYGYTGSPNESIAVIDTGIDDSHPDIGPYGNLNFSRKIVGWYDATVDKSAFPEDYCEHGTHCAVIAAGTGDTNSLQGSGFATTTWSGNLTGVPWRYGYLHYGFEAINPGLITLTCMWTSDNTIVLQLRDVTGNTVLAEKSGNQKPLVLTYNAPESGRYRPFVGIGGLPPEDGSGYFSLRQTYPYEGRNDGYNLFTGVAPTSKLVGVKVFDNTGNATTSTVYGGMDWVIANKDTYNITVASMSIGIEKGGVDTTFDQKANTMVENGIVTCVSAGNDFPDYYIGSPGTAAYVITVAATNDQNGITFYSSNGNPDSNPIKPDVTAPGGSTGVGNLIISGDSNDVDYEYSSQSDYTPNDYQQMMGTSMSTPHVAGLAALIIDALSDWNWTRDEALKVKMIISMTAFEVQSGEEPNVPPLNRGDKDNVEGYGRICADAAIEAVTMTYSVGDLAVDALGSSVSDKKVWARQVLLSANTAYGFNLSVLQNADYDLYLYDGGSDSYGQPSILAKSINSSNGAEEAFYYMPAVSTTYYLVVKWVSGSGEFNLTSEVLPLRDVAVVSVLPSVVSVYSGGTLTVTVVVENQGVLSETFNVALHCNESVMGVQPVTSLAAGVNITLSFIWDTENVAHGYYNILATAEDVPWETDPSDNSLLDGIVHVRIPGDIEGDGHVNLTDAVLFSTHYGWPVDEYPDGDINYDGYINVLDAIIIVINWTG